MLAKTALPQCGILALFILIPLFRPILIAHQLIYPVYAIFALGFLVLFVNLHVVKYAHPAQLLLLLTYTGISIAASLFAAQDIRLDYLGLLCFLPISYCVGIWLGTRDSAHCFFRAAALIFLPITAYVVYQLSRHSFSYNTYYYWSSAAYKIDYLTTSLYAGVLLIYFVFNGRNVIERYVLTAFCFSFIAISGARYSIMFAVAAGIYVLLRAATRSPAMVGAVLTVSLLVSVTVVVLNESLIAKLSDSINYSLFRLENLSENDRSVEGRVVLMQKAGKVISDHFSFGVGLAGSSDALGGNYPHNMLLEAFVDGGLFSMLPLLLFLGYSLYLLTMAKYAEKVWCLLLVVFVLGAFLKSFSIYESRILFFFIGYATALCTRQVYVQEDESKASHFYPQQGNWNVSV